MYHLLLSAKMVVDEAKEHFRKDLELEQLVDLMSRYSSILVYK